MGRNTKFRRNHSTIRRQELRRYLTNGPVGHTILKRFRVLKHKKSREIHIVISHFGVCYYANITCFNNLNAVWDKQYSVNCTDRKELFRYIRKQIAVHLDPAILEVENRIKRKNKPKETTVIFDEIQDFNLVEGVTKK